MSYTLRGRIESRLAALLGRRSPRPRVLGASSTAGGRSSSRRLMIGGRARARPVVYDRLLDYQPGWVGAAARRASSSAS